MSKLDTNSQFDGMPVFDQDFLVALGGWSTLKEGRKLAEARAVSAVSWEPPILAGEIALGGSKFNPLLNLRSVTFAENRCQCAQGRKGYICAHAVALCVAAEQLRQAPPPPTNATDDQRAPGEGTAEETDGSEKSDTKQDDGRQLLDNLAAALGLESLEIGDGTTANPAASPRTTLNVRFYLPPNLARQAPRDAIPLKVSILIPGGREVAPENLARENIRSGTMDTQTALALWSLAAAQRQLGSLCQVTRRQLSPTLELLSGRPVFFWINNPKQPIPWKGSVLEGVSPLLETAANDIPARPSGQSQPQAPARGPAAAADIEQPPRKTARPTASPAAEPADKTAPLVDGSEHFLAIALPSRSAPAYREIVTLLRNNGFKLEPSNRKWWLRDRHKTLAFLAAYYDYFAEELHARFTDNFRQNTRNIAFAEIVSQVNPEPETAFHTSAATGNLTLELRGGGLDERQWQRLVISGKPYADSPEGNKIVLIKPQTLKAFSDAQRNLSGDPGKPPVARFHQRVPAAAIPETLELLEEVTPGFAPPEAWQERSTALAQIARMDPPPLSAGLDGQLRLYQRIGTAWLWHIHKHRLGGVLADEMGLGKTIQALGLIQCIQNIDTNLANATAREKTPRAAASAGPSTGAASVSACLVVCPASLAENWRREATRFTPELRCFVHHRDNRLNAPQDISRFDLVITTYGTLTRDSDLFQSVSFRAIIADEAHHIKNRRTQNARALSQLRATSRFALTGTPLENSLDDLRSLFAFLMPGYLASLRATNNEERAWFDERHRRQAAPYILRRTKEMAAPELPPRIEQTLYCEMTPEQRRLYEDTRQQTQAAIDRLETSGASQGAARMAVFTQLLRLRQICVDPRLVSTRDTKAGGATPTRAGNRGDAGDVSGEAASAKLAAFEEILDEALDNGSRILLFSQFTSALKLVALRLETLGLRHCYLDGQTRDRQQVCDRFNADPDIPVFLISLKAGGTGLNLTGADTVVIYDPWWNPAAEAQAIDRAHRIGQERKVTAIKLITAGAIEEKVLELQRAKAELFDQLMSDSAEMNARIGIDDIKALVTA